MKVGILNFHRALNYGAVLQCYGLQEVLKELGHDVEVIDYRPYFIEKKRKIFDFKVVKKFHFLMSLKIIISNILSLPNSLKAKINFDNFLNKYLHLSKEIITPQNAYKLDDYDIIFVGSDQVWSERITQLDSIYLGEIPRLRVKYVSYAASLGSSSYFNDPKQQKLIPLLKNYSNISVREVYLKEWLKDNNYDSVVTLDPSLLANEEVFNSISTAPKFNNYVLFIDLHGINEAYDFACKISSQLKCKLYTLKASGYTKNFNSIIGVSPSSYLGLIKNAQCIITSSFHAVAFSIVFRKDFYALQCNADDRYRTLLNTLGIEDRLIESSSNIDFNSVDYSQIDIKLQCFKEDSMSFILTCFQ